MLLTRLMRHLAVGRALASHFSTQKWSNQTSSFLTCQPGIQNCSSSASAVEQQPKYDKLFRKIELEFRGHDPAVLYSYITFVRNVCNLLEIQQSTLFAPRYERWLVWALRSKFAKKKYMYHYETRTHIRRMHISYLTGSTASTFLEYIQRNIPEGVALKATHSEMYPLPDSIINSIEEMNEEMKKM